MAGTVTRVQYFDHQFLQVGDFTAEQDYHREMLRVHNTSLHTAGVATGLTVTAAVGATSASVAPGVAIDGDGNELVLAVQQDVDLSGLGANQTTGYIVMSYAEQNAAPASDGSGGNTRFTEDPDIVAQPAAPTDNLHLLLGTVAWSGTGATGYDSNPSGRLTAGAAGGDEAVNSLSIRVSNAVQANWPKFTAPASNQAELNCALAVDGVLTAGGSGSGGATINGPLTVYGTANVSGALTAGGPLAAPGATLSGALSAASGTIGGALSVQGILSWGSNNAQLFSGLGDQGGSIELGGNDNAQGTGTPYVDFHFQGKQEDYNTRLINDGDGQLTLTGEAALKPTNRLVVRGESGIRQERLYISGGTVPSTWSSISFNACHGPDANGNPTWRFPDTSHPAVTLEIDASMANGGARFEVYTTTKAATQTFARRLGINGETGIVTLDAGLTSVGVSAGADPGSLGYVNAYESVGVVNPAYNLRLQSPNWIIFHTANVQRGWFDNGGTFNLAGALRAGGTLSAQGGLTTDANGRLGVSGQPPAPRTPGWGGGIHTWDLEVEGTGWSRNGWQSGARDMAENFDCDDALAPGDVVVLDPDRDVIVRSSRPNDPMVVGVVSGAPAVLMGADPWNANGREAAVGLIGRLPCRVTTENGPIARGEMLTSASTPGAAMRAQPIMVRGRPVFQSGTIIGKALEPVEEGEATIDIFAFAR